MKNLPIILLSLLGYTLHAEQSNSDPASTYREIQKINIDHQEKINIIYSKFNDEIKKENKIALSKIEDQLKEMPDDGFFKDRSLAILSSLQTREYTITVRPEGSEDILVTMWNKPLLISDMPEGLHLLQSEIDPILRTILLAREDLRQFNDPDLEVVKFNFFNLMKSNVDKLIKSSLEQPEDFAKNKAKSLSALRSIIGDKSSTDWNKSVTAVMMAQLGSYELDSLIPESDFTKYNNFFSQTYTTSTQEE